MICQNKDFDTKTIPSEVFKETSSHLIQLTINIITTN
jgi:hypothetical protein